MIALEPDTWTGCYSGSFNLISAESLAHPAKMAPGLCYAIIEHLENIGLLKEGDTILDPMAGTGLTAICAGAKGYKAVTVELESQYIDFQKVNRDYAGAQLHRSLDWTIIQADSRQLSWRVPFGKTERVVTITSPPYQNIELSPRGGSRNLDRDKTVRSHKDRHGRFYEASIGQIGAEPEESYLESMRTVYGQILTVSDVLVVVTKNPTRNHQLRRLDLETIALLESSGWKVRCTHKAMLFHEQETVDLFGNHGKTVKGRLSFFRRLNYKKGYPVPQWEDIICATGNDVTGC